jgi:hypothetical protein
VYDIIEQIAVLLNEKKGNYQIDFDATELTGGLLLSATHGFLCRNEEDDAVNNFLVFIVRLNITGNR